MTLLAWLPLLAQEGGQKTLWNPTIIGVLTVLCAVGLFCGSVYLLLGTNLGARLGFLVAAAGLTGFLLLLTTLWWTSGNSGIDPPHGNSPSWKVIETVSAPSKAETAAVRQILTNGKALTDEQLTNIKPAIDAAVVSVTPVAGAEAKPQPLAKYGFSSSTDYLVAFNGRQSFTKGGGTKNVFWHNPKYAVVEFCPARKDATGANVIPPQCDPLQDRHFAVLEYDLGSLRQPVVAYWFASLILFSLSLLGLHWWEKDERARKRAALTPVPSPGA